MILETATPMTAEELQDARVVTAREIWFIHDSWAEEVRDFEWTLLSELVSKGFSSYVKFIIAQNTARQVTLGIFYPDQSAAVCGHALRNYLNWTLNSLALSQRSDILSYWSADLMSRPRKLSPTDWDITLIWWWEIHSDVERDMSFSMTLQTVFDLRSLSHGQMVIVRSLVLQKLGVTF